MSVITFTSRKGGVGKTTTTLNVAGVLATRGHRVLAIDLDPQANLTKTFVSGDEASSLGVAELLDPSNPKTIAEVVTMDVSPNIDLVMAVDDKLEATAIALQAEMGGQTSLRDALQGIDEIYDYALIDTKPDTAILTQNAVVASDGVVALTDYSLWGAEGATSVARLVELARRFGSNPAFLGVLFNSVNEKEIITKAVGEDIASLHMPIFEASISNRTVLRQASYAGETISAFEPRSESTAQYEALATEIHDRLQQTMATT